MSPDLAQVPVMQQLGPDGRIPSFHDQRVDADHPQDPDYAAVDRATRSLSPAMGVKLTKVPDGEYGFSLSGGSRANFGGDWTVGGVVAITLGNTYNASDAQESKYTAEYMSGNISSNIPSHRQTGIQEVKNSLLTSLGLAKGDEQSFGFTWLRAQSATDRATIRTDEGFPGPSSMHFQGIRYTERSLDSRQLTWERKWDRAELELFGAHNLVRQYDPDTRIFEDYDDGTGHWAFRQPAQITGLYNPSRIWRDVQEDNSQYGIHLAFPFRFNDSEGRFKLGALRDLTHRSFQQSSFVYQLNTTQRSPKNTNDVDAMWWFQNDSMAGESPPVTNYNALWTDVFTDPNRIGAGPYVQEMRWLIQPITGLDNITYEGEQRMPAGYWMLELPLTARLKAIYGARLEVTDMSVDPRSSANSYHVAAGYTIAEVGYDEAVAHLQEADWLRSAGLVYEMAPQMNLRVNWSQTIARPTFRELAPALSADPIEEENYFGNNKLKISHLENDDVRWEWFRKPGEVWSVSWFYKHIIDPIDKVTFSYYGEPYTVPINTPEGQISGMEYEVRKKLDFLPLPIGSISVGANYTEMKSTVTLSSQDADDLSDYKLRPKERESSDRFVAPLAFIHTPFLLRFFNLVHATEVHGAQRDMAGQPAFLFNFNLSYDIEEWGTSLNWFYNIRGDMLKTGAAPSGGGEAAYPDLYSKQLATVNLNLTQKIGKNFSLTVGAQNLLNPAVEEFYRLPDGAEYTRQSYHEGKKYFLKLSGSW